MKFDNIHKHRWDTSHILVSHLRNELNEDIFHKTYHTIEAITKCISYSIQHEIWDIDDTTYGISYAKVEKFELS